MYTVYAVGDLKSESGKYLEAQVLSNEPIKWVTKYEQIERMIRERIAKGEIKPGEKLESEELIAQKLGVHRFTVNKALASLVREGLLRRVQGRGTYVAENDGKPRTGALAVLYSASTAGLDQDVFFGSILQGLRDESGAEVTMLGTVRQAGGMIGPPLKDLQWDRYDGLVLLEIFDEAYIAAIKSASPLPVVVIDYDPQEIKVDHVVLDNRGAGKHATEYLLKLGHKRIAHLGEPPPAEKKYVDPAWQDRRRGWEDAMRSAGLDPTPLFMPLAGRGSGGVPEHMARLLKLPPNERPTAFFGAGDDIALKAMRAAQEAGVKVPEEMSFIGFGDQPAAALVRPGLTTFRALVIEMGRWAYRRLKSLREGADHAPHRHVIPVKMIERESCAPPPK